jgi:cephalosporin hydroxylase
VKRLSVDFEKNLVEVVDADGERTFDIGSPEGFDAVSWAWLRAGWDVKYVYGFSWLGRPIIQLPEDLIRLQEVIFRVQPDVIIETGIAHGGSLVFSASLCKLLGRGRVIGVDIEIRPHNRAAIEAHPLFPLITLVEGSSTDPGVVDAVRDMVGPDETVLIFLDSDHSRAHVQAELEAYGPLVSVGSYVVAMDGIMERLVGAPRAGDDWASNNPRQAALDFLAAHPEFEAGDPPLIFDEGLATTRVTYWPDAFLKRVR